MWQESHECHQFFNRCWHWSHHISLVLWAVGVSWVITWAQYRKKLSSLTIRRVPHSHHKRAQVFWARCFRFLCTIAQDDSPHLCVIGPCALARDCNETWKMKIVITLKDIAWFRKSTKRGVKKCRDLVVVVCICLHVNEALTENWRKKSAAHLSQHTLGESAREKRTANLDTLVERTFEKSETFTSSQSVMWLDRDEMMPFLHMEMETVMIVCKNDKDH